MKNSFFVVTLAMFFFALTNTVCYAQYHFREGMFDYSVLDNTNCVSISLSDDSSAICADSLRELNIPSYVVHESKRYAVKEIGERGFAYCGYLEKVLFPKGLEFIGDDAFRKCYGLKSLVFPADTVLHIGVDSFYGCSGLEKLYFPRGTFYFTDNPFSWCDNLREIVVDPENEIYDSRDGCNALIMKDGDVLGIGCLGTVIPNGVAQIHKYAFAGCRRLVNLHIPASVTTIQENAFQQCLSLTGVTIDPENPVYKEDGGCIVDKRDKQLVWAGPSAVIPAGVEVIGSWAFSGMPTSTCVDIPEHVRLVKRYAFYNCPNLSCVSLPLSTVVKNGAFDECKSLQWFRYVGEEKCVHPEIKIWVNAGMRTLKEMGIQ